MSMAAGTNLRVCFPFVGATVGGSKQSTLLLAEGLREIGIDPVFALHEDGPLRRELDRRGLAWALAPPIPVPRRGSRLSRLAKSAAGVRALSSWLRRQDIDVVHTNDPEIHPLWGTAARLAGKRFVWHHRTDSSRWWREGTLSRLANAIITISNFSRLSAPPALARRAHVIDNPFDPKFSAVDRADVRRTLVDRLSLPEPAILIGFVGRLIKRKRVDVFVDIARLLHRQLGGAAHFLILGDGPLRHEIAERVSALGLERHCLLMGEVRPIEEYMAGLDVLVAPAEREPFGRVLVEAALLGIPVVASDEGGHREIIDDGETGLLVAGGAEAYAAAVAQLIGDETRRRSIAAAAREAALRRFSIAEHASRVSAIYADLDG